NDPEDADMGSMIDWKSPRPVNHFRDSDFADTLQHCANVISYENVWEIAEACWAPVPGDRTSMSEVLKRFREDPSLLCETADALQYIHSQGLIHGDVKGNNVLIGDRCQALLCDFGLTREYDVATSVGLRGHGTVRWQSPELLDDSSKSFSSDAYAFGMTIAEVLTGQLPFNHLGTNAAVMCAVLGKHERPKQEPQVCPIDGYSYVSSWAVAAACWATAPEDRISMTEAFSRLDSSREEA
ncbi:hypothetical protein FRC05_009181, partial [Tulasnella sp. 425]